ncbi:AaceriAER364Wp [[Ashbya] aceris (nom. inval.)]|nr:AaceriAER364Wp [[Ashbya] aceris (nom. inval.)]
MLAFTRIAPKVRTLASVARMQLRTYASYPPHTIIGMPALSPTMTQGNLAVWTKKEGDKLSPGEVLAEVETDKAQMDFEFQEEGYLAKILVPEGAKDVPVNKPIAVYVEEEGDVAAFKDFKVEDSVTEPKATPAKEEAAPAKAAPAAAAPAKAAKKSTGGAAAGGRILASPLAKTIALEKGISLKEVTGTGPNGRITKEDVEKYLAKAPKKAETVAAPAAATYEDVPISNMRRVIGARLLQSCQSIPSFPISSDISVAKLLKLRQSLNAAGKDQYKLSINDILIKAIAGAAKRVPEANAYWLEDQGVIRLFKNVDVSVAVATPTGLITPIVKNAESKGLRTISAEIKELGKRAKENKLAPHEFQGGTICISNLGMNNAVSSFGSIINPPQSAILSIGTLRRVPVEDAGAEYGFTFEDRMNITGVFDHRTIDGARAAEFMRELKNIIENPLELML